MRRRARRNMFTWLVAIVWTIAALAIILGVLGLLSSIF
jgi:hypothetical protein